MEFLQGIGKKVTEAAKSVGKITSEAAEITKLKSRISQKQREIEEMYAQLGKAYYATAKAGEQDPTLDGWIERIDALKADIEELERAADSVRQVNRCASCNSPQPEGAIFCANCGARMNADKPQPDVTIEWPGEPKESAERQEGHSNETES